MHALVLRHNYLNQSRLLTAFRMPPELWSKSLLDYRHRDAGGGPAIRRNSRYSAKAMAFGESKSKGQIADAPQASFALSSMAK